MWFLKDLTLMKNTVFLYYVPSYNKKTKKFCQGASHLVSRFNVDGFLIDLFKKMSEWDILEGCNESNLLIKNKYRYLFILKL